MGIETYLLVYLFPELGSSLKGLLHISSPLLSRVHLRVGMLTVSIKSWLLYLLAGPLKSLFRPSPYFTPFPITTSFVNDSSSVELTRWSRTQSFQSSGFFLKSGNLEASGFSAGFSSGHDLWSDFRILKKCLPTVVFFTLVNCKLPSANLVKIDCALYVSPTSQSVPHWSALITRCAIWRENRQCTHGVLFLAWVEAIIPPLCALWDRLVYW